MIALCDLIAHFSVSSAIWFCDLSRSIDWWWKQNRRNSNSMWTNPKNRSDVVLLWCLHAICAWCVCFERCCVSFNTGLFSLCRIDTQLHGCCLLPAVVATGLSLYTLYRNIILSRNSSGCRWNSSSVSTYSFNSNSNHSQCEIRKISLIKAKIMYMYTAYVLIKPILWANYCLIAAEEWEATMNDRMETKEKKKLYIINFDFIKKIYVFLIWKPEQCELIAFYLLVSLFVPICFSSSYS